jgi:hypothetical protein
MTFRRASRFIGSRAFFLGTVVSALLQVGEPRVLIFSSPPFFTTMPDPKLVASYRSSVCGLYVSSVYFLKRAMPIADTLWPEWAQKTKINPTCLIWYVEATFIRF